MKIKVSEATEVELDYLVATITKVGITSFDGKYIIDTAGKHYTPSRDDAQGGPICYHEQINLNIKGQWEATIIAPKVSYRAYGHTPLVAAMRCYVISKLGNEVDIPETLTWKLNHLN